MGTKKLDKSPLADGRHDENATFLAHDGLISVEVHFAWNPHRSIRTIAKNSYSAFHSTTSAEAII